VDAFFHWLAQNGIQHKLYMAKFSTTGLWTSLSQEIDYLLLLWCSTSTIVCVCLFDWLIIWFHKDLVW
jgi:hypothetical protein